MSLPVPADTVIGTVSGADSVSVVDADAKINPEDAKQISFIRRFLDRVHEEVVGAVGVGAGLLMVVEAMKTWADLSFTTSRIEKIQRAKSVHISDLCSISNKGSETEKLVVVRGFVRQRQKEWFRPYHTVKSQASSIEGVCLKTTTSEFLNDVGFRFRLPRPEISVQITPMVINISSSASGWGSWVDIDLSSTTASTVSSSFPLETTFQKSFLESINPFFYGLKEEKILPVGKEITAIGRVSCQGLGHTPRLTACQDLPFFVSDMTKDQMLEKLFWKKCVLLCSGVALGSLSIYVLSMTFRRYWQKIKNCSSNRTTVKEDLINLRRRFRSYLNALGSISADWTWRSYVDVTAISGGILDYSHDKKLDVVAAVLMALKARDTWSDLKVTTSAVNKISLAIDVLIYQISRKGKSLDGKLVSVRGYLRPQFSEPSVKSPSPEFAVLNIFGKLLNSMGLRWVPSGDIPPEVVPMKIVDWGSLDLYWDANATVSSLSHSLQLGTTAVGKEVTAIGYVSCKRTNDGLTFAINSCDDLPYFYTELTRGQMLKQLSQKRVVLFWSGLALGSLSVLLLAMSFRRHWRRWKEQQQNMPRNEEGKADNGWKFLKSMIARSFS